MMMMMMMMMIMRGWWKLFLRCEQLLAGFRPAEKRAWKTKRVVQRGKMLPVLNGTWYGSNEKKGHKMKQEIYFRYQTSVENVQECAEF